MTESLLPAHDLHYVKVAVRSDVSVEDWLLNVSEGRRAFVLVHALDGVIWGRIRDGRLGTAERRSREPWPALRWETMSDLRLFSLQGEVRAWRDRSGALTARAVAEAQGDQFVAGLDRAYLLLGKDTRSHSPAFDVRRSQRGEQHAVPRGAARLLVRHSFIADPNTGLVREAEHRWLDLLDDQQQPLQEVA